MTDKEKTCENCGCVRCHESVERLNKLGPPFLTKKRIYKCRDGFWHICGHWAPIEMGGMSND